MRPEHYARLRPDTTEWLDLRGFLLSGRCQVHANPKPATGFVVRAWDLEVAVAAGEPSPAVIHAATAKKGTFEERTPFHLLAPAESVAAVTAALPAWPGRGVVLHRRADDLPLAAGPLPPEVSIRLAPDGWAAAGLVLGHLAADLRQEYATPLVRSRPLAAAMADGLPVAFCYAAVASESLWDVAVDTLSSHRRQGLAAGCFAVLAAHMRDRGLAPVWGALENNEPSMRLATKLGFHPEARLVSFARPR